MGEAPEVRFVEGARVSGLLGSQLHVSEQPDLRAQQLLSTQRQIATFLPFNSVGFCVAEGEYGSRRCCGFPFLFFGFSFAVHLQLRWVSFSSTLGVIVCCLSLSD